MISLIQGLARLSADTNLQLLRVLLTFGGIGLCILIVFSAQLFLIYQIEQGRFFRKHRDRGSQPRVRR